MSGSPWKLDPLAVAVDVERGHALVTHRVAGPGTRFVAGALDFFIRIPPMLLAGYFISRAGEQATWQQQAGLAAAALFALEFLYGFAFEAATSGQTPGKNACACRVVNANGSPATLSQFFIRNVARLVDILPAVYLAGGVACWISPQRQRLGDRFAGTIVVFDDSLRDMLRNDVVPDSVYSTSEDAYLLESVLLRGHSFREEVYRPLIKQLAQYFYRKYS
jgi:uncharacterized RDD family membrane protein YckC